MDWPDYLRDQALSIDNLPSRPTILSLKPNCLSWRPCVMRSPITLKII
jgi:hypothetical protein